MLNIFSRNRFHFRISDICVQLTIDTLLDNPTPVYFHVYNSEACSYDFHLHCPSVQDKRGQEIMDHSKNPYDGAEMGNLEMNVCHEKSGNIHAGRSMTYLELRCINLQMFPHRCVPH
jgi:hypothetical protein